MQQDANAIWQEYQRGKDYLSKFNYYSDIEESYRFYNGDQWNGLKFAGEKPASLNILAPIADHKIATVAQNGMIINYGLSSYEINNDKTIEILQHLNEYAIKDWERLKMDRAVWEHIKDASITGDAYIYFFDKGGFIEKRTIDATSIHFGDEQEQSVQEQPYIIIPQRLLVSEIKEEARNNGIDEHDISLITPDSETEYQIGEKAKEEIKIDNDGKCIALLKMWKESGTVHFLRCVKNVIYQEDTDTKCALYPIANFKWNHEKGAARGVGEIHNRIPNQIEINKALARYLVGLKQTAFPHMVYKEGVFDENISELLQTVGSALSTTSDTVQNVKDVVDYIKPPQIDPASIQIVDNLSEQTRELAGAGDIATGDINPEKASGTAIIAVRDANSLTVNFQIANCKQFIEDIALIWLDMRIAYNPNGLPIIREEITPPLINELGEELVPSMPVQKKDFIPIEEVKAIKVEVKIDVSPKDPYTKAAQEKTLENLLAGQLITMDEWSECLDANSAAPKEKIKQILDNRKQRGMLMPSQEMEKQQEAQMHQLDMQILQLNNQMKLLAGAVVPKEALDEVQNTANETIKNLMAENMKKGQGDKNGVQA